MYFVGAGGLGCELLKDLALCGFGDIHVIDMDTIELSNLNRQFLFRQADIGLSKAECAARFINKRIPTCNVTGHFAKIQDFDDKFYQQFHIIVCGLDSIMARRWINGMLMSHLIYDEDGTLDSSSVIPLIDGGTEGFKGNARIILPGLTPCIECTLDLFPAQVRYPLCTIANTPRLPEHCIEYVKLVQWDKENPFNVNLDCDDPHHVAWIYEKSLERANKNNITGVTLRLVQGVIKNIIPAVASTNAAIAAVCANEAFKMATSCYENMQNFMMFNDEDGIYTHSYTAERRSDCLACSGKMQVINIDDPNTTTLDDIIKILCDNPKYQMKQPGECFKRLIIYSLNDRIHLIGITTLVGGKYKTLYISTVKSIEEKTRSNLTLSLGELGLKDGQELMVADQTTPNTVYIQLKYQCNEVEMN